MADINQFTDLASLDSLSAESISAPETVAPVEATVPQDKGKDSAAAVKQGAEIYRSLSEEQKQTLNASSDKITFISLLGAKSKPSTRMKKDPTGNATIQVPTNTTVGIRLYTSVDLDVPVIPFKTPNSDLATIPDFDKISYRHITAGSEFFLNRVEGMYLFTLPKYQLNGYCSFNGEKDAVAFVPRFSKPYRQGGLPTPTWRFTDTSDGREIKGNMVLVDDEDANGNVILKPEYAEAFADLAIAKTGKRGSGTPASSVQTGTKVSLAIAALLQSK